MALKARPLKSKDPTLERIFNTYDENLRTLDERTLAPITKLSSDATTADIVNKMNEIIDSLNNSDLTR